MKVTSLYQFDYRGRIEKLRILACLCSLLLLTMVMAHGSASALVQPEPLLRGSTQSRSTQTLGEHRAWLDTGQWLTHQAAASSVRRGLPRAPLVIITKTGTHRFHVEVARTESEQALGLMGRPPLAPDAGMIFPMRPWRPASFWMKNTPSSLDIIFIAPGGKVLRIAPRTTPLSLQPIESGGVVEAVLEIGAGRSAEIGLAIGDQIKWPDSER